MTEVSEIEVLRALKAVRAVSSPSLWEPVFAQFVGEYPFLNESDKVKGRLNGLLEEDEFSILCRLMGTCTELVQLDGRPLAGGSPSAPDFLAEFRPGCRVAGKPASAHKGYRCLVDVKTTEKHQWKLGGAALERLRAFAKRMGLPLLFAFRFTAINPPWWQFVLDSGEGPIKVTGQDLDPGVRHVLWDDYSILLSPGLQVEHAYEKTSCKDGVYHKEHGLLVGASVLTHRGPVALPRELMFVGSAFLDCFGLPEISVTRSGEHTTCRSSPSCRCLFLSQVVRVMNGLPSDEEGMATFDASRLVARCDQGEPSYLPGLDVVTAIVSELAEHGVLTIGTYGKEIGDHLQRWVETGGV